MYETFLGEYVYDKTLINGYYHLLVGGNTLILKYIILEKQNVRFDYTDQYWGDYQYEFTNKDLNTKGLKPLNFTYRIFTPLRGFIKIDRYSPQWLNPDKYNLIENSFISYTHEEYIPQLMNLAEYNNFSETLRNHYYTLSNLFPEGEI